MKIQNIPEGKAMQQYMSVSLALFPLWMSVTRNKRETKVLPWDDSMSRAVVLGDVKGDLPEEELCLTP